MYSEKLCIIADCVLTIGACTITMLCLSYIINTKPPEKLESTSDDKDDDKDDDI